MKKLTIKQKMLLASGLLVSGSALADSAAAMTAISTEASNLIADAWPILTTIVVAMIAMKLFKKFANKAS